MTFSLGIVNFETPYLTMNCLDTFRLRHPNLNKVELLLYDNSITGESEDFF